MKRRLAFATNWVTLLPQSVACPRLLLIGLFFKSYMYDYSVTSVAHGVGRGFMTGLEWVEDEGGNV